MTTFRRELSTALASSRAIGHTRCPWKGRASYYSVESNGQINPDAAWYYPRPWPLARRLKGYVAFWNGATVQEHSPKGSERLTRMHRALQGGPQD